MGYPLSVRGQVCRAQGPLPCVAATVLCSWRLPSLGRVPMSSVPRRRRYYEGATTSHPASRSLLVRDRVPRGPPRFVLAEALPGGWEEPPEPGPFGPPEARFRLASAWTGWDLTGSQAIHPVPLPCSKTPAESMVPHQSGPTDAAPAPNTAKASAVT